jgi:plasmid stabilization system protein ParE
MRLRFTPRALADAKRMKTWWRRHRTKAPDLFERELEEVLERLLTTPSLGAVYEQEGADVGVRRLLMPRTQNQVYYAVTAEEGRRPHRLGCPQAAGAEAGETVAGVNHHAGKNAGRAPGLRTHGGGPRGRVSTGGATCSQPKGSGWGPPRTPILAQWPETIFRKT